MKSSLSLLLVPFLLLTLGCSTRISHHHGYDHGHRSHNHVSVGVRSNRSGAAVIGALVVGGIIGSIIADSEHEKQHAREDALNSSEDIVQQDAQGSNDVGDSQDLSDNIDEQSAPLSAEERAAVEQYNDQQAKQQSQTTWYQVGKDSKCYLMGIEQGITNVISTADAELCKPKAQ